MGALAVAVIIPAYNEEQCIAHVIRDFHRELPQAFICVVNNNSSDGTERVATEALRELGCRGEVITENRQGKSMAVKRAFSEIIAECYVIVDADMTYPASYVHELLKPVQTAGYDMTVGDRHSLGQYKQENKRAFHNFGNALVAALINVLFRYSIKDAMSGYRVVSRGFVALYPIKRTGFELETEMTIHAAAHNCLIKEIPIGFQDRPQGSFSKLNTFRDGYKVIKLILRMYKDYRPIQFFSVMAMFFALLSLGFGVLPVYEFFHTGLVGRVPMAVLSASLGIISVAIFSCGIILDTIKSFYFSQYELSKNLYYRLFPNRAAFQASAAPKDSPENRHE